MATYYLGFAIIIEASLSFLGVGAPPDDPSWGGILTVASKEAPETGIWLLLFPGIFIFVAVLGFNILGDALRDILDPKLRGRVGTSPSYPSPNRQLVATLPAPTNQFPSPSTGEG